MRKRVLIVEDDELVADQLASLVRDQLGCIPIVTRSHNSALAFAENSCDFGFLDVKVKDGDTYPLACRLRERGVPFAFVSATDPAKVPPELAAAPFLRKPVTPPRLLEIARQHL